MTNFSKYTDLELIEALINEKDNKWFAILYDRYASRVYNKCILLTHSTEAAKDLTHDIFIKVFIHIREFKGTSTFFSWLFAITYNTCINYLRKSKMYNDVPFDDEKNQLVADEIDDGDLMEIELSRLKILLEEIPTDDKIILLLKYQDGMSINEIGQVFKIGESATKMRISRAKGKINCIYNSKYIHSK